MMGKRDRQRLADKPAAGTRYYRETLDKLAEAAGRGGLHDVAVSLANERLALKPRSHVNQRFLVMAQAS